METARRLAQFQRGSFGSTAAAGASARREAATTTAAIVRSDRRGRHRGPLQDAGHNSNDGEDGRDDQYRRPAHADPAQERQHDDVVDCPSQRRCPQPAGRRLRQPVAQSALNQGPERQHDNGAKEGVLDMSHIPSSVAR